MMSHDADSEHEPEQTTSTASCRQQSFKETTSTASCRHQSFKERHSKLVCDSIFIINNYIINAMNCHILSPYTARSFPTFGDSPAQVPPFKCYRLSLNVYIV